MIDEEKLTFQRLYSVASGHFFKTRPVYSKFIKELELCQYANPAILGFGLVFVCVCVFNFSLCLQSRTGGWGVVGWWWWCYS